MITKIKNVVWINNNNNNNNNNLSRYVRNSKVLHRKVGEKGTVKGDEAKDPEEYKKSKK